MLSKKTQRADGSEKRDCRPDAENFPNQGTHFLSGKNGERCHLWQAAMRIHFNHPTMSARSLAASFSRRYIMWPLS